MACRWTTLRRLGPSRRRLRGGGELVWQGECAAPEQVSKFVYGKNKKLSGFVLYFAYSTEKMAMKTIRGLMIILTIFGLFSLAAPAEAQRSRGHHGGGGMHPGGGHHGHNHGGNVNFFVGGFGFPFFYGYPYWGYPAYYGYPYGYGYGYPGGADYGYGSQGVYNGRVVNPQNSANDGVGKDYSMAVRVQRELAQAGYYRGAIDGVIGDGTRRAIRNYERDNGLPVDGRIDDQLLATMGIG